MGEPLEVFSYPVGVEALDGLHDLRVECLAAPVEQAAVRHLVGKGVLEGVFGVWKQAGLVEELAGLKPREAAPQVVLGEIGDRLQQVKGDVLADDGRGLEQVLLLRPEPIDPGGKDRLNRRRDADLGRRLGQPVSAGLTRKTPCARRTPSAYPFTDACILSAA
jgi:hypothetical protein